MFKKSILLFVVVVLILTVSACSGNNEAPDIGTDNIEDVSTDNGSSEDSRESDTSGFVPSVAVPEDLPIYPGKQNYGVTCRLLESAGNGFTKQPIVVTIS